MRTRSSAPPRRPPQPGHILTRFADKYGRAVAFAFAGTTDGPDLAPVFVDAAAIAGSTNHQLLASGLVYPTYYSKLFVDLRAALNQAVAEARAADRGVWPNDLTTKGVTVDGLAVLTDTAVLLPKLFRRLVDYLSINSGDVSLAGLPAYLATRDDRVIVASTGQVHWLRQHPRGRRADRPGDPAAGGPRLPRGVRRAPDGARQASGDRR